MTKYEEIRETFRQSLPRRLALNKAIEELPLRLRNAVESELDPPDRRAEFLSAMHREHVTTVYLACLEHGDRGQNKYKPCSAEDALFRDYDGVLYFGLGLALEGTDMAPFMLHWLIALENITEKAITLKIVGAPGIIDVKIGDVDSYRAAAKAFCDWMLAFQSDPTAGLVNRGPIGFRSR